MRFLISDLKKNKTQIPLIYTKSFVQISGIASPVRYSSGCV